MSLGINEILSFSFKGRVSRSAYWRTLIVLSVLSFVGVFVFAFVFASLSPFEVPSTSVHMVVLGLAWAYFLTLTACLVSVVVRRLHDINYSGMAALFLIIPGLQFIMIFVLGFWEGKKGLNRFGPDPLAVMTLEDAAPVVRGTSSKVRPAPQRVVRETPAVDILEPHEPLPKTDAVERMDADAEDWAKARFDETLTKLNGLSLEAQDAREAQKTVLRQTYQNAQKEGRLTPEACARWLKLLEAL